jgi:recombination protein RecR
MYGFTPQIQRLIEEFKKIPGIGQKSAQRISFYLLKSADILSVNLANAIIDAKKSLKLCSVCNNITACDPCEICTDPKRDADKICILEEPFNIYSIEKTQLYRGYYHILHGNLSPLKGIGPDELKLANLLTKIRESNTIKEIIIATSATTEGNATAHYLSDLLKPYKVRITRIALGLPVGADIDYVDSVTIAKAFECRTEISGS